MRLEFTERVFRVWEKREGTRKGDREGATRARTDSDALEAK